jgi:predicted O-methyltransferase YrrM
MRRTVFAPIAITLLLSACHEPRDPRALETLDVVGQSMLAPVREEALAVPALIERLALPVDATIADIGAGPGFLTLPLARAVRDGQVIATDIRRDYLDALAVRAHAAGLDNVTTRVVSAGSPGLAIASVDLALLCQVDHALADRAEYFRALVPALRRGGRIALVNYLRYREADREAAARAALAVVDEWEPSGAFFLMVVAPEAGS